MKKTALSAFRKMRRNAVLLVMAGLLVAVGSGFFVTLFTISSRFKETVDIYFSDYRYADCTYYGGFTADDVAAAKGAEGVAAAAGRFVRDYRSAERIMRVISVTDGVNGLYYFSGGAPDGENECAVNRNSADAMGIEPGETVELGGRQLTVTGIAASPEYIYLARNERSPMSDPASFATVYVTERFFSGTAEYNELVVLCADERIAKGLADTVGADSEILRTEQLNYSLYTDQQKKIQTFAYIFPSVFAFMIVTVVYVILQRVAKKERMQIAVYKSLGCQNGTVLWIYLGQFLTVFLFAALFGSAVAIPVTSAILNIFGRIFTVPILGYHFYPALWAIAVAAAAALCLIPGALSLSGILRKRPAQVMRPAADRKGGGKILLERVPFVWRRMGFNSRYTFKSMLRSKGRFFAIVTGIMATVALTVLSFGFYNSIDDIRGRYFNGFANYDMTVSYGYELQTFTDHAGPLPFADGLPADAVYGRVLQGRVRVKDDSCFITAVGADFDQFKIDAALLAVGVIISSYHADVWDVAIGDSLSLSVNYSLPNEFPFNMLPDDNVALTADCRVSGIVDQTLAIGMYIGYDYLQGFIDEYLTETFKDNPLISEILPTVEIPMLYNAVFLRAGDISGLKTYLSEHNIDYTTRADDEKGLTAVTDSITILIFFMIVCALILGVAVLYSVGLINLNARENEFMLLQTLGYPHKKIMATQIKESIMQTLLALPLGYLLGYFLLWIIKNAFSSASFVMFAVVYWPTYLLAAGLVVLLFVSMTLITSRRVARLDIVEGLKSQE